MQETDYQNDLIKKFLRIQFLLISLPKRKKNSFPSYIFIEDISFQFQRK